MKKSAANIPTTTTLTGRKVRALIEDPAKCAEAVDLVYVSDKDKGIARVKKGNGFVYMAGNKQVDDADVLLRIKKLVLPPAWQQVWICTLPNGHLQATGVDAKNRKQYRYHAMWNALRGQTKFFHLADFAVALPAMRKQIKADLALLGLPMRKVLATIVALMDQTGIRVGGNQYEKMYGTFGLTTMKDKHVAITGDKAVFSFKGKKGVYQNITLKNKKLARIIRQCRDIPGKELFQYFDENGERKQVDSGMVNEYIKEISGQHFTSKDFRTWVGTLSATEAFKEAGCCDSEAEIKKKIVEVVDIVAKSLGNTRAVCRKYYIHPAVIDHYTNGTIMRFFEEQSAPDDELTAGEVALIKMLGKASVVTIVAA